MAQHGPSMGLWLCWATYFFSWADMTQHGVLEWHAYWLAWPATICAVLAQRCPLDTSREDISLCYLFVKPYLILVFPW